MSRRINYTAMEDDSRVLVDDDESRIVTEFLFNTCRMLQPTAHHVHAAMFSSLAVTPAAKSRVVDVTHLIPNSQPHNIPLTTGSVAEFYIRPMLSCVGDVDIMDRRSDELAIPEGYPPPTELLAAEFDSIVTVYEITDSEYPGYVYLMKSYLLTEDIDTGKYSAVPYERKNYVSPVLCVQRHHYGLTSLHGAEAEHHGPAMTIIADEGTISVDRVYCTRCLSWPPQAADWPTRRRNHGWPDSATVGRVVCNGCDVVHVAHPLCKQDEWMNKHQWRLSFSRAEIVLLNSWMPVQQIVYHMLRFLVKTRRLADIRDSTGTKVFSNYHLKTSMLWACELLPRRWWTDDVNVVKMCAELLDTFSKWLTNNTCLHYFVSSCNVAVHSEIIASRLGSITESWLSTWFVNNYLPRCAQLCPDRVSRLFDDVSTSMKLQNAVSAVVDWRLNTEMRDFCSVLQMAKDSMSLIISIHSLTVLSCDYWIKQLSEIDSIFCDCFIAVAFLHVANRIAIHSFSDELMDVLTTIVGQFVGKRCYCHQLSSEQSLSQAVILMKDVANNSGSTVQQIKFELSKAYLHRALRCNDSDSDSVYCLANVYLAVLYYTTGQYQTAIDHCAVVMRSRDHSQCSSHVVRGELLPKIDDDVDTVLGLAVFYQYVRTAALNERQTQHVVAFTTDVFAHNMYIRCLSVVKCHHFTQMLSTDELQRHTTYVTDNDQLLIADVLLVKSTPNIKYHVTPMSKRRQFSTVNATVELVTLEMAELLQRSAIEHLTTYRQLQAQEFGSVTVIVTTDFESLYAYKHGDYHRCLQLSTQNVHTLLYSLRVPDILILPEFLHLMDDDIVSLTALTLIVNPKCRSQLNNVVISQLNLSLYLMTQCQLKLRHSVKSLVQTFDYIKVARRQLLYECTLNHLILKLTERKLMIYLSQSMQH